MESSTMTGDGAQGPADNRKQLILVLVVFLGPVLAAVGLYATAGYWMAQGPTGQHGHLYQPAKPLETLRLTGLNGETWSVADLRGKWSLLVLGAGDCGNDCRDALYKVRQAHKAQGKNIGRVQRLFVALGGKPGSGTRAFLGTEHPHLKVATPAAGRSQLIPFQGPGDQGLRGIYLLDPYANLVMRYDFADGAEGILEDLKHLLKHSTIG